MNHRSWRCDLAAFAYDVVLLLLLPILGIWLLWRLFIRGKPREGLGQRLGSMPPNVRALGRGPDPVIWVQTVSVGEVAAAQPFLHHLRIIQPLARIVVSTTTSTGQEFARSRLGGDVDAIFYFPFDFPFVVQRAIRAINPRLLVMVETELWPNILAAAKAHGAATALINGRISDAAYRKDRLGKPIISWALRNIDVICAQSGQDAERFKALGARPDSIEVMGNTKFDERFPMVSEPEAAKWRQDFGFPQEAPVLVAGSTHPGEEELILKAYAQLRRVSPDLMLVIAPRHPERGDEIEQLISECGYATYRRSRELAEIQRQEPELFSPDLEIHVVLLDTIGELAQVFSIASIVFMGGSLVPRGGHNVLQPLAQGCPVVFGPHMQNFRDITDIVLREGAAVRVYDFDGFMEVMGELLESGEKRQALGERGRALIADYSGAAERMAERVGGLLH